MKNDVITLGILLCVWITGMSTANAGGRTVTLFLRDGTAISGELINVRIDQITVCAGSAERSDKDLLQNPTYLTNVPVGEIEKIYSEGHSHVAMGMLVGTGVGTALGAIWGAATERNEKENSAEGFAPVLGGAMGLMGGFIIGTISGIASSSHDLELRELTPGELSSLARSARFAEEGPPAYGIAKVLSKYGFKIDYQGRVQSIIPGSSAFMNNIRYRDSITSVNGNPLPLGSFTALWKLVNVNDSITVSIQRGTEMIEKKLAK